MPCARRTDGCASKSPRPQPIPHGDRQRPQRGAAPRDATAGHRPGDRAAAARRRCALHRRPDRPAGGLADRDCGGRPVLHLTSYARTPDRTVPCADGSNKRCPLRCLYDPQVESPPARRISRIGADRARMARPRLCMASGWGTLDRGAAPSDDGDPRGVSMGRLASVSLFKDSAIDLAPSRRGRTGAASTPKRSWSTSTISRRTSISCSRARFASSCARLPARK